MGGPGPRVELRTPDGGNYASFTFDSAARGDTPVFSKILPNPRLLRLPAMNASSLRPIVSLSRASFAAFASLFLIFAASLQAGFRTDPPIVSYDPTIRQIQGTIPFSESYLMTITAPNNLAPGVPVTVTLTKAMNGTPSGVADAVALSYVTFSSNTLTFSNPSEAQTVTVTMAVPLDAVPGPYGYQISTIGWPADPTLTNDGSGINGNVTILASLPPPTINIDTPVDGWQTTVAITGLPLIVPFSFTATGATSAPITSVDADMDGLAVTLDAPVGLNTPVVTQTGTMLVTTPGLHHIHAHASSQGGSAEDTNGFTVNLNVPPPTVVITTPLPGASFDYRAGNAPTNVAVNFTATSAFGGIRTLTAQVDGVDVAFNPSGIGNLTATGSLLLPYTEGGSHTVTVTTTDDYGTATAQTNFTINYIAPTPTIAITTPTDGQVFTLPVGVTTMNVPYSFTTTSNNGFVVNSVSATLGTTAISPSTLGLGTALATSSGTLTGLASGTYTLTATGTSAGISVQASITFTIKGVTLPPSVAINTPPVGSVYTRVSGGPALSIPLTFTGTSNTPGGVITNLTASLDGTALSVVKSNIGQAVATGAATMSVSTAGTHTISVTAVDAYGTASATRTFTVNVVTGRNICGSIFFDVDADGRRDCSEFGLSGVTVNLLNASGQTIGSTTTNSCGSYSFLNQAPGTYSVSAVAPAGLLSTTTNPRSVTISGCNVCVPDIGFALNFKALQTMTAGGFTIGYWKNNLDKAISGKTSGIQVTKTALVTYTNQIACLALSPYDNISMKAASSIMGSTSSAPTDLLSKQLIASEYNYENAAYIGGNKNLTFLFVWWGEYVLSHPCNYSSTYILWAKDWFDAYNNSHGGVVAGPSS
jgi:hypothetical protein